MGNYKFKFSDMIPNAWFYKLRDLGKHPPRNLKNTTHSTKKKLHHPSSLSNHNPVNSPAITSPSSSFHHLTFSNSHQRKSYYITRDVNQTPSPNHDTLFHPGAESTHEIRNRRPGSFYDIHDAHGVHQPPRRSSKKRRSTRRSRASPRLVTSSVRAGCSCRATLESAWTNLPDSTSQEYPISAADTSSENEFLSPLKDSSFAGVAVTSTDGGMVSSCSWSCRLDDDIVIDVDSGRRASQFVERIVGVDSVSRIELPPIKTSNRNSSETKDGVKETEQSNLRSQSAKYEERNGYKSLSVSVKVVKEDMVRQLCESPIEEEKSSFAKSKRNSVSSNSPGVKLRTNSPRIVSRRSKGRKSLSSGNWRRGLSESFAVVKSSKDPQRDFKESMVEMIVENNMWSSKELEDLLACYLSLNSDEYHHLIINVFKQIWFDVVHAPLH